jgi:hypothetical protein
VRLLPVFPLSGFIQGRPGESKALCSQINWLIVQIASLEAIQSRPQRTLSNLEIVAIRADHRNYKFLVEAGRGSIGSVNENTEP